MKAPKFWMIIPSLMVSCVIGFAYAKLPPPSEEAKAAAAAKKEKAAEAAKKESEALAKSMDRAVDNYKKSHGMTKPMAAPATKK